MSSTRARSATRDADGRRAGQDATAEEAGARNHRGRRGDLPPQRIRGHLGAGRRRCGRDPEGKPVLLHRLQGGPALPRLLEVHEDAGGDPRVDRRDGRARRWSGSPPTSGAMSSTTWATRPRWPSTTTTSDSYRPTARPTSASIAGSTRSSWRPSSARRRRPARWRRTADPRVLAYCMFGTMNWTYTWFRPGGRVSVAELADMVAEFTVNGLRNHSDGKGAAGPRRARARRTRARALI